MALCDTCGRTVDDNAISCPGCGRQHPGAGNYAALNGIFNLIIIVPILFIFVVVPVFIFVVVPVIWLFAIGLNYALHSLWAWLGFAVLLAVLGWVVYKKNWQER